MDFYAKLAAANHATNNYGRLDESVTTSGWYRTSDGWHVHVTWHAGRVRADTTGLSSEALNAFRAADEAVGVCSPDNWEAWERHVLARLGLA